MKISMKVAKSKMEEKKGHEDEKYEIRWLVTLPFNISYCFVTKKLSGWSL